MNPQYCLFFSLWCLIVNNNFCGALSTPVIPVVEKQTKIIPITVISGFLGSGKTTLLQHMLENKQGIKIAVIVNDVASVNIDSKLLVSSQSGSQQEQNSGAADGMVQLQNGCACCSLSEELLGSVSELVTLSDIRGESGAFDHIVVELSGVADPKGVRAQFQDAIFWNMPLMERVRLDTMITVVDCSSFLKYLKSNKAANRKETPELFYREGEKVPDEEIADSEWMKDMPPALLEALLAGDNSANVPSPRDDNAVANLLVSQTETADIVLLNKVDLVNDNDDETTQGGDNNNIMETIRQIVQALNPKATVEKTSFGAIPLDKVLAVAGGKGVVEAGVVDDHRGAIQAAENDDLEKKNGESNSIHDDESCTDPDCTDNSHSHSHHHHHEEHHSNSHSHDDDCSDPDCTDASHNNNDSHQAAAANSCDDPDCTESSHSHSHNHNNHHDATTLDQLGIGSFVYRARKPFHPQRLVAFLRHLPVSRGLPEKSDDEPSLQISDNAKEALQCVVRSKGFVWLGDSNVAANYWSHAGSSFELQCLGRWWSTLSRPEWPPEAVATILSDFDDPGHNEEDRAADSVGDRRQEVVFIGPGLVNRDRQADIVACLNQCLLDDKEWEEYKEKKIARGSLRATFVNSLSAKMLSY